MKDKKCMLVVLVGVSVLLGMACFLYEPLLNSDMASELVLAKQLAKENSLFSAQWYYSTEIRVVYMTQIAAFFFKFVSSYKLVRIMTDLLLWSALFCSLRFFLKTLGVDKKRRVWASVLIMMPISMNTVLFVLIGQFYTINLCGMFVYMSLVFQLYHREKIGRKRVILTYIVLGTIGFLMGTMGARGVVVFLVPQFGYMVYYEFISRNQIEGKWTLRVMTSFLYPCITMLVGLGINHFYLASQYTFRQNVIQSFWNWTVASFFDGASGMVASLLGVFGYQGGVDFISLAGVGNVVAIGLLISSIVFVTKQVKKIRSLSKPCQFLLVLFISDFSINIFLNLFGSIQFEPRYYLFSYMLLLLYFVVYCVEEQIWKRKTIRRCGMILLVLLCMNCFVSGADLTSTNGTLTSEKPGNKSDLMEVGDYLIGNGYELGYSNFWSANVLTELTDGAIAMTYYNYDTNQAFGWLTEKKNFDITYSRTKKRFGLVNMEEYGRNMKTFIESTNSVIVFNNDSFYVVDFSEDAWTQLENNFINNIVTP